MGLEALSTNEHFNFIIYDTFSATPTPTTAALKPRDLGGFGGSDSGSSMARPAGTESAGGGGHGRRSAAAQGRKKRRRRAKVCKNKEEAETQRMTHIVVERNRRKLMNEHLAVLQSLMPESYVQRGDQASIVGGAIEYVKELEHLLQSLEAQKLLVLQQGGQPPLPTTRFLTAPFAQFFAYPQYTWSQFSNEYNSKSKEAMADIEVTLIETHVNLRILSRKNFRQLSKLVTGFQTLWLTILHLNVTTLDPLVLYSISAKVEEGCQLTSADEIAGAVHHMLRIIEEEATLC
ncbi:Transcription factor bHLH94 like [Actinidia chinensis var. chinensis]|uniref:Transcription factor bHLH94 like n=1 Tax=Actinidia chinensis var. chinensis TaxID=1590841 RepID=A0A2R6PIB8_ACTCC|nr:Transcription factor bHLH94 like [Actinidia chinensis var. chinensis]